MDEQDLLRYSPFTDNNVRVIISLRSAGDMRHELKENREELYRSLEIAPERVFTAKQIHSKEVEDVSHIPEAPLPPFEADGLVSCRKDHLLGITVADCLPIFLADRGGSCFGAFHSGWKGTGIVQEGVMMMKERYGVDPGNIEAFIGPSIGPCCYQVDRARQDRFRSCYGDRALWGEKLDLPWVNSSLLQKMGIPEGQITIDGSCTCCDDRFGSFRREGPSTFTRMLALIGYFQ